MSDARRTAADTRLLAAHPIWQTLLPTGLPQLSPCTLTLESRLVTDPADLERIAEGFDATFGWLERQSRLALVGRGNWPGADGGFDAILAGELAGASTGLLIRRVAEGWRLTRIGDRPDPDSPHLCHEETLAGVERLPATGQIFGRRLRYRVYWRHAADAGWRRCAARLLGSA